jgi:8-oxo-dGTP pyrophosphatase MutT (NUDIX family)
VTPVPAATVVLLRDTPTTPEVFMVRRHDALAFMGGAYVFPGGRVDATDRGPEDSDGFRVAAVRELFEEGGILIASDANGHPLSCSDETTRARFEVHRRAVIRDPSFFRDVIAREHLRLDLERLVLFAHWITPPRMSRRFDTRFFAARTPPGQTAFHDAGETVDSAWMRPHEAVARASAGQMDLPPPTRHTLEQLSTFHSVDEILAWYNARPIERHEPQ